MDAFGLSRPTRTAAIPARDDVPPRNSANELMHGWPCANDTAPGEGADAAGYRVFLARPRGDRLMGGRYAPADGSKHCPRKAVSRFSQKMMRAPLMSP